MYRSGYEQIDAHIVITLSSALRGHSQTTWTERHTYMGREMSTNVNVRYIHGQPFVHVDMISFKILKSEKNLLYKKLMFFNVNLTSYFSLFHYYEQLDSAHQ